MSTHTQVSDRHTKHHWHLVLPIMLLVLRMTLRAAGKPKLCPFVDWSEGPGPSVHHPPPFQGFSSGHLHQCRLAARWHQLDSPDRGASENGRWEPAMNV